MIYVRMELWPGGDRERATCLGEAVISNTGEGTKTSGSYHTYLSRRGGFKKPVTGAIRFSWREGCIDGFPRKRLLAWDLLFRVLKELVGERSSRPAKETRPCR